ncbi:putative ribosomal N-acetyltransferase YdaF [bioreactor metagenome]|uniref:Putative ribosomal N-acetyltransferase YdaF n=1 Tax=bioreactor metagenome TaxID=1076179 RepID=A0A645EZ56_9ZZZZ
MELIVDNKIKLRQLIQEDAADIFAAINSQREYLGKWLPFVEQTKSVFDTQSFVDSIIDLPKDKMEYTFTIRIDGSLAGLIGFKSADRANRKTEIGYWLSEEHQGKGVMTKSVKRLCEFAFQELNMNRIQIKCAVGNSASIAVPERLGFMREGIERDGELLTGALFTDLYIFSLLFSEA